MGVIKKAKVRSGLLKKGFIEVKDKDHVVFQYLNDDGQKTTAWTKYSHGKNEVSEPLIRKMAMQTQLSRLQFEDLVNCPMSKERYREILKEKGIL